MTRATLIVLLLSALPGCSFEPSSIGELSPCVSELDCPSPRFPICARGFCVANVAQDAAITEAADADAGPRDVGPSTLDAADGQGQDSSHRPTALPSVPLSAAVGDVVLLDGAQSRSSAPPLTYLWNITTPPPEQTQLTPAQSPDEPARASFAVTRSGRYEVSLIVVDEQGRASDPSELQALEVTGFERFTRPGGALDVYSDDGQTAWVARHDGAWRFRIEEAEWSAYELGEPGTTKVVTDHAFAWFARPGPASSVLRVRKALEPDSPAAMSEQPLSQIAPIRSLHRAPNAVVWFGGENGLQASQPGVQADSESIIIQPRVILPLAEQLGGRWIKALASDPGDRSEGGKLWIGRSLGVCASAAIGFVPVGDTLVCDVEPVIASVADMITAMTVGPDRQLWVATDGQGLYRRGQEAGFHGQLPGGPGGLPPGTILDLEADAAGTLWGLTATDLFRREPSRGDIALLGPASGLGDLGELHSLHVLKEPRQIWVAGSKGVAVLRP